MMIAVIGILLIVAGAIVAFAIDRQAEGVDLHTLGWILIGGGGLALLVAAIQAAGWASIGNRHAVTERHVSPDGGHYVEESHFD